MQGKVSIVMPCYNKVNYIGEMFDSIIAQEWDNIELILVNDGSTDGTREVIAEYEPKFRVRGFEVTIVDQENAGVCAAAKAGLERITGDYVCMVDADDELDPKYVSTMAGWLEEHLEDDYTTCDHLRYICYGYEKKYSYSGIPVVESGTTNMTELYFLVRTNAALWSYMVRVEYFQKCLIVDNYDTSTMGSHEPSFIIPLTAFGGKIKSFTEPLYKFNVTETVTHSRPASFFETYKHYETSLELHRRAIELLPKNVVDDVTKEHYYQLAKYRFLRQCISSTDRIGGEEQKEHLAEELVDFLNQSGWLNIPITLGVVLGFERLLMRRVERVLLGESQSSSTPVNKRGNGRVIGYGAMGKAASNLIPLLIDTNLEPDELWDIRGDGRVIKKPDFDTLKRNDILLFFPVSKIENELSKKLQGLRCRVMYNLEILDAFADERFNSYFP